MASPSGMQSLKKMVDISDRHSSPFSPKNNPRLCSHKVSPIANNSSKCTKCDPPNDSNVNLLTSMQYQTTPNMNPNSSGSSACLISTYSDPSLSPILSFIKDYASGVYSTSALLNSNNQLVLSQAAVSMSVNYLEHLARTMIHQTVNSEEIASSSAEQPSTHDSIPSALTNEQPNHVNSSQLIIKTESVDRSPEKIIVPVPDATNSTVETCDNSCPAEESSTSIPEKGKNPSLTRLCAICSDASSGFHCNAFVCEACKKFFIRSCKSDSFTKYTCLKNGDCTVDRFNRTHCQFCRYQKCCRANMTLPGTAASALVDKGVLPCRVCGATSSGFHFGAFTCEGCKGFFRRSIQECEKRQYVCTKGGNCLISPINRNNCKACRFVSCLRVGMCREGSRIGRQPNAVKFMRYREIEKLNGNDTESPGRQPNAEPDKVDDNQKETSQSSEVSSSCAKERVKRSRLAADSSPGKISRMNSYPSTSSDSNITSQIFCNNQSSMDLSLGVDISVIDNTTLQKELDHAEIGQSKQDSAAHKSTNRRKTPKSPNPVSLSLGCDKEKSEFIESCVEAAASLKAGIERMTSNWTLDSPPPQIQDLWRIMMKHFEIHTVSITNFAKKVPGFEQLHLKDKKTVVKDSLYPIILLCLSRDFDVETNNYNYFDFSAPERELILQTFPSFRKIGHHLCVSGRILKKYQLNDTELALLSTVALYTRETSHLQEPHKVKALHQTAMDALIYYEEKVRAVVGRSNDMIKTLSELTRMNEEHHYIVRELKCHRPELQFPKLYTEVFQL